MDSPPLGWNLQHSYAELPALFHQRWRLTPVRSPNLVLFNHPLARSLGLNAEALSQPSHAAVFAGSHLPPTASPLAQAYAGHQFGNFTALGDGRALLLGEQITPSGQRFDIQLKGSGPTPFSRGGDGRAALGPMLREHIISEAMHALRIPTTRSLAVATTGESVVRQSLLPGAVLTRVAASHIRIGTFQWAAAHQDPAALLALTTHTLHRHHPHLTQADHPALALLESIIDRQAALVARWMHVGFIHGVLNTDNVTLSGESIDYGPCAFMDQHHANTVFSSIDRRGRYAYGRQPEITHWNLTRLAEALLPLLADDETTALDIANTALTAFPSHYALHWLSGMRSKLGLFNAEPEDTALADDLLAAMTHHQADHTHTFATLSTPSALTTPPFPDADSLHWHSRWTQRLLRQPQSPLESLALRQSHNPAVIPRNHKVEEALTAASDHDDFSPLHRLLEVLAHPYDHQQPLPAAFREPAPPTSLPYQTFCGT